MGLGEVLHLAQAGEDQNTSRLAGTWLRFAYAAFSSGNKHPKTEQLLQPKEAFTPLNEPVRCIVWAASSSIGTFSPTVQPRKPCTCGPHMKAEPACC